VHRLFPHPRGRDDRIIYSWYVVRGAGESTNSNVGDDAATDTAERPEGNR
jgi:hypothetical protein